MSVRLVAVAAVLVLLVGLVAVGYVIGERPCPPPDWAFWRADGSFACVTGRS